MNNYAVIFCRESTEEQARSGLKMDVQEKFLRNKAKELKLIPVGDAVKIAETGSKDRQRRKFYNMLKEMKDNSIKNLLVEKADRLMRETGMHLTATLKKITTEYDLEKIYFPGDSKVYDVKKGFTADESLMMDIMGRVAGYKSDIISEEVSKAFKEKVERGEPVYTPPVGYRSISKDREKGIPQRIIQTEQAPKVKEFLQIFHDKRYSLRQMLEIAKNIGLKSSRGNPFKVKEDVRRIIRSKFYHGDFEAYGEVRKIKTAGYKPLITKKMWKENQRILDTRRTYIKPDTKQHFKFSQLINCGRCGRVLYAQQFKGQEVKYKRKDGTVVTKRYSYQPRYVCTKGDWKDGKGKMHRCDYPSFWQDEIEDLLSRKIILMEFDSGAWDKVKERLFKDEERSFLESEIQYLEKERTRNETRLDNLYSDCKEKKIISAEFMSRKMMEIEKEQKRVEERLSELKDTMANYHNNIGRAIEILDSLKNFDKKWKEADDEKRREMLRLLTIKISTYVHRTKIKGKKVAFKDLDIVWNDEVRELSELELIKKIEEEEAKKGSTHTSFNCEKNRD